MHYSQPVSFSHVNVIINIHLIPIINFQILETNVEDKPILMSINIGLLLVSSPHALRDINNGLKT